MKYLPIILILLLSCSVEKKSQRKVAYLIAHDKLSEVCARVYPNMDSITKGDSVILFDTLYIENDVVLRDTVIEKGDTVIKEKKCPPVERITKTVFLHDTVYRTNTAEVDRLKGVILEKEKQLTAKDAIVIKQQVKIDKNDWWKMAALITWFALLLGIVFRLFIYKRPI